MTLKWYQLLLVDIIDILYKENWILFYNCECIPDLCKYLISNTQNLVKVIWRSLTYPLIILTTYDFFDLDTWASILTYFKRIYGILAIQQLVLYSFIFLSSPIDRIRIQSSIFHNIYQNLNTYFRKRSFSQILFKRMNMKNYWIIIKLKAES